MHRSIDILNYKNHFLCPLQPCRFGISCTSKATCRFSHPALPAANQLRWTPQAAAKAAEEAAAKRATSKAAEATRLKTAIVKPTTKVIKT